jgi:adenylate cyclase
MRRTLTVILASDVAGYSRLVAANEEDTVHRFRKAAAGFTDLVKKHRGKVFNTAGDAILARFDSALDATLCAIEIQQANNANNSPVAEADKLLFRIGLAIGDVLVAENGDLLGDAVNIAARLENLAEPGGICISDDVHAQVINKIRLNVVDLGDQNLRNISRAVRVYRLVSLAQDGAPYRRAALSVPFVLGGSGLALAGVAAALIWFGPFWSPDVATDEPFDAQKVPLVSDRVRESLGSYLQEPDFKALALSTVGWGVAYGAADVESAKREALDRCQQRDPRTYCRIYSIGDRVVMPKLPLPLPEDVRATPLDVAIAPEDVKWLGEAAPKVVEDYLKQKNHRAIAFNSKGNYMRARRRSLEEAARLAIERCSDRLQAPCFLLTVNGFLTVRMPRTHTVTEFFMLATESEMSAADKRRIGQIYLGQDWRALARGGGKEWFAVSDMPSEQAAIDAVMRICGGAHQDCALHAINNFRVEARK